MKRRKKLVYKCQIRWMSRGIYSRVQATLRPRCCLSHGKAAANAILQKKKKASSAAFVDLVML